LRISSQPNGKIQNLGPKSRLSVIPPVGGTLLDLCCFPPFSWWATLGHPAIFVPKKDPPQRGSGIRGRKLLRDTHESTTDAQARLYRKSAQERTKPSYFGHVITENRNGLIMESCVTEAGRRAEMDAALSILGMRALGVVPLVAEFKASKHWKNWLRASERSHPQFAHSQKRRRLIEKVFSWIKTLAGLRQTELRGRNRVDWLFRLTAATHNLIRMAKLIPAV
jgi:hypothetical protein